MLGCGHAHLAALLHWRCRQKPVVITRAAIETYSGLVPSVLRGERQTAELTLDRFVAAMGGRMVVGTCVAIDLAERSLRLADGGKIPFGLLSLDLGAASACPPGAVPTRPATALPDAIAAIEAGPAGRVIVVGGGAVGTELALALAVRWRKGRDVALLTPGLPLSAAPGAIRRRAARALSQAHVARLAGRAVRVDAAGVVTEAGCHHDAVAVLWAAGVVASGLPRAAGLDCDAAGFVRVDSGLRSVSHPFVLAVGDGAALGTPKSGAFAVSAGRALARSLARMAAGEAPHKWRQPRHMLAIIGAGNGKALAWRGKAWLAGPPAWWLKQVLDQRWVRNLS